jgi:UDP-N-acetylglucosamine 4,6-dehydratase/5-epimerase
VDVIVHAAALKQVPSCEYNPFEAVRTNVHGAENVVNVALDAGVPRVIALSTDKAVNPINLYGATKLCADKIFVQANAYSSAAPTRFACIRYGNVVGSRGSVLPLFRQQRDEGLVTITDERMTRFWITPQRVVEFVSSCLERMRGGEIFVPKIPSMRVADLADAVAPGVPREVTGIRAGEKLHEVLLTTDEARHTVEQEDRYVIYPEFHGWPDFRVPEGRALPDGFVYQSDTNDSWVTEEEVEEFVRMADALMGRAADQLGAEAAGVYRGVD